MISPNTNKLGKKKISIISADVDKVYELGEFDDAFNLTDILRRQDSNYSAASNNSYCSQSSLRKPTLDETKFLAMPLPLHKRDFKSGSSIRSLSAGGKKETQPSSDYSDSLSTSAFSTTMSALSSYSHKFRNPPCALEKNTERINKVKALNHAMWLKDVITNDERYSRKCANASERAEEAMNKTLLYFQATENDCVSKVQESLNNLNETCEKRLAEIEEEQRIEEDKKERLQQVRQKRKRVGNSLARGMAHGKIQNVLDSKVQQDRKRFLVSAQQSKEISNGWNSNTRVKPLPKRMQTEEAFKKPNEKKAAPRASSMAAIVDMERDREQQEKKKQLQQRAAFMKAFYSDAY